MAFHHKKPKIPVTLFFRKRLPSGNFSIESMFADILRLLGDSIAPTIAESGRYSKGLLNRILNVWEAYKRRGPVNHVTGDVHFLVLGLPSKQTILTIHDCGFIKHPNWLARFVLWLFWVKLPVMHAGYITAVSEATKKDIVALSGCRPEKVRVIPTNVSFQKFAPVPKAFNAANPKILAIGTAPNKNLPRIIRALAGINCTLIIIGKLENNLNQLLNQYRINFQNSYNLSDSELFQQYVASDLLLFPSTLEGFGMPILEAQIVERPVITSNLSSMPEVAGTGACLVNPYSIEEIKDAVLSVIHDQAYRQQLIENGRQNWQRYSPEKIAEMYYDLYREVLEKQTVYKNP